MEMEAPGGGGILSRLSEKVLGWIALAIVVLLGIAIYQMPADTKSAIWSGFWRSVVWFLLAAGVPWTAALFIRRVVQFGTNWAGIGLIAGFTLADVLLGISLMTVWPSGAWAWAATIAAVSVAGIYNYLVCEYLAERSGL
ncbi:MAG: hypothetical protein AMXMBFR47_19370 [Planctomycetota bacterium]